MRGLTYAVIIYFPTVFIFKLLGDLSSDAWANYFWVITSAFLAFTFLKISTYCNLSFLRDRYDEIDIEFYRLVFRTVSVYWGVMLLVRTYVFFNIGQYQTIISSANKLTLGGFSILLCLIFLIAKKWLRK